jgi:hypothetical protein
MKCYGWSAEHIQYDITGAQGWVYYYWALENEASVWGTGLVNKSPGYLKQEWQKILESKNG